MIGVATADLVDQVNGFKHPNSLCIYADFGTLYHDGTALEQNFQISTGDRITVRKGINRI